MSKLRDKIVEAVYLSSLSTAIYNTAMLSFVLVTTNVKYIQSVIDWSGLAIIMVFAPLVFSGVILSGFILDKYINYARTYAQAANKRNPEIMGIYNTVQRLEEKIDRLSQEKK